MPFLVTPQIGRRRVLRGLAAAAAVAVVPGAGRALAAPDLVTTPQQTEGPFYPKDWAGDIDNDLVRVHGEAAQALGKVTHVMGRVLDTSGASIAGARVEIWQCDASGVYRHPADTSWLRTRDPGFQGRGRVLTPENGAYAFRTIRPVAYPGRTPHIHFAIEVPGRPALITQMYVAGEPQNERDFILNNIKDARQRAGVIVNLEPGERMEADALVGTFDIVLPS